ncbi:MAG: sodium:solute symporter [Chloroflexota bacterium]|nr:sodium:solute symporter [Chloroflexota bacterium]
MHWDEIIIVAVLGLLVTGIGFGASRWRRGDLDLIEEWGLAGRRFGTIVTWFLLGGDLYTAYTFVAVPALVFGMGAIGLFALPYTIIVYPLIYLIMPRLWQVARNKGYVTASDFVKDRFDSRFLALLIALTGIVATMPYIALQMLGIAVVIQAMGVNVEVALVIAFLALAVFTYASGLRAPALIAIVKDTLIWITVIVALIVIPTKLGGFTAIFAKVPSTKLILAPSLFAGYSTLALGSALALFLYPHAITGTFASKSQQTIKRNMAFLPAYSFLLGLIALLGYMAIAAGIKPIPPYGATSAVPQLFQFAFPSWFAGFAFAAIAIGALVPASVMSIAAANLFCRNVWVEFVRPAASPREETQVSKIVSLLVKVGAVGFILIPGLTQYAITLQLAGGVWILQTLPAVFLALFVNWLDRRAIIAGWALGMASGTYWLLANGFTSSLLAYPIGGPGGTKLYIGLVAFAINLAVVVVGSIVAHVFGGVRAGGALSEANYQPVAGEPAA